MRTQVSFGVFAVGCLITCASPAKASYSNLNVESNKNILQVDYNKESEVLFGQIKVLYFAIGCKVVPSEASLTPYIHGLSQIFEARAREGGIRPNETVRMKQAAREGMAKASEVGACEFWRQHPEMVRGIRTLAKTGH